MSRRSASGRDGANEAFDIGYRMVSAHPLLRGIAGRARVTRDPAYSGCPPKGWALVNQSGLIEAHPTRHATAEEWAYVLGHAMLHLALGHFRPHRVERDATVWNAACDVVVARLLQDYRIGRPPAELAVAVALPATDADRLYEQFLAQGIPDDLRALGTAGASYLDMRPIEPTVRRRNRWGGQTHDDDWERLFADGVAEAVAIALEQAAGYTPPRNGHGQRMPLSDAERARRWFMDHYPLLGALAASFRLVEDRIICHRLGVSVAAVSARMQEIYCNPAAGLTEMEWRFVLAHEFLHVALRHFDRVGTRHPVLWNFATDFCINDWLSEMQVGAVPDGVLLDVRFHGLSAESVYDALTQEGRRAFRLASFRGTGVGDMLDDPSVPWWVTGDGVALDELYRRAIAEGLVFHQAQGRGTLPAGLVEAIYALDHPPLPWDVELARWFEDHFAPIETRRSYFRLSRRQAATPDIPRPRVIPRDEAVEARTFGVVFDTSCSMSRETLGLALGAIESYATAHDVAALRLVYCDATPYDQGYVSPQSLSDVVSVMGRGGTVLQPALDLLERADDFPPDAPVLVITDGACDPLVHHRSHAYLMPAHTVLPFAPQGPVFRIH